MRCRLLRLTAIAFASSTTSGAPANPLGRLYDQPDGSTTPELFLKGNEHYSWMTDKNGYSVVKDAQGWWVYAKKIGNELVSSGLRVGLGNPKKLGITTDLKVDPSQRINNLYPATREHRELLNIPASALCNFEGTKDEPCRLKGIVVLVKFSDHNNRVLPAPEEYDILFNHNGPTANSVAPTGSVSDVWRANSYGSFVLESHVTDWIPVPRTEAQTVDGKYGLNTVETKQTWRMAMEMVAETRLDLSQFDEDKDGYFDCLVLLHSGAAAEAGGNDCESNKGMEGRIWSHSALDAPWFTSSSGIESARFYVASGVWDACPPGGSWKKWDITRIAVIAHECAHFLGLPDMYNADSNGGAGSYELLANMWGWSGTQYWPPLMGAWSKYKLEWVNAIHVTTSATYTLHPSCMSNTIYRIDHNMPEGEYFLVEYRDSCGFDSELKGYNDNKGEYRHGAALWHVDETDLLGMKAEKDPFGNDLPVIDYQTNAYPGDGIWPARHYRVAVVQADGNWDLEQSINRGDLSDLFKKSKYTEHAGTAYKIGPDGLVMNNGSSKRTPNTNSYTYGYEKNTGITIEFGTPDATMSMTVTLAGPAPTPRPTLTPTPRPTPRPTIAPTRLSTPRPTIAPTLRPTFMPTQRPTPLPMPMPTQQLSRLNPMTIITPRPTPIPTSWPTKYVTMEGTPTTVSPTPIPTPWPFKYVTSPTPWPVNKITPAPQHLLTMETAPTPGPTPLKQVTCSNFNGKKSACKRVRSNCKWRKKTKTCASK